MRVVLLDNVKGIGHVGDVKDVNDGYARNFLIPRKLARTASEGVIKEVQNLKAKKLQAIELAKSQASELADKINGLEIKIPGRANEQGTLFAGIEPRDIAKVVSKSVGIQIVPAQIKLDEHIKSLGAHSIKIELAEDVSAILTLKVESEK